LAGTTVILRKTSLVDYPGRICAVIFFPGCGLRCPWCQNRELVLDAGTEKTLPSLSLENALGHIGKRRSLLGGVVLSGGEPTLYSGLEDCVARIKALGLSVKLDTNGMSPQVLRRLLRNPSAAPDHIALDLKFAPERYGELLPGPPAPDRFPGEALRESAALVRNSGLAHEFRSLVFPGGFFGPADIKALSPLAGKSPWRFRPFRPGDCLDPAWNSLPPPSAEDWERLGLVP
jgi:pyruvate formate lyase activating enzyme